MSHEATRWAVQQRGLKPAERIVLFCLADRHNTSRGCFPSQQTLADDAEMSERSVRRHLASLEAKGLIERVRDNRQGGAFASTRYILCFERQNDRRQDRPAVKLADGQPCPSPAANLSGDRRPNCPPNPVREPCKRTSNAHRAHSAHLDARADAQAGASSESSRGPTFGEFWQAWPLRRQGRARAEKAWRQLSAADRRDAIEQVAAWAEKWRAAHPQASDIHPSTFINGRRWEDELTAPSAPAAAGARDCERDRQIAWFRQVAQKYAQ